MRWGPPLVAALVAGARPVGLSVITLFGIFVLTTALPLRRALHRTAGGAENG
jgi:hypothetical protein